jgi:hypothetical protein
VELPQLTLYFDFDRITVVGDSNRRARAVNPLLYFI